MDISLHSGHQGGQAVVCVWENQPNIVFVATATNPCLATALRQLAP